MNDMTTCETTTTHAEARRWARHLLDWGFTDIEVIESVPSGNFRVRATNRAGRSRTIASKAEFIHVRDFEA